MRAAGWLAALDTILFTNQHLIIEALCAKNIGAGGRPWPRAGSDSQMKSNDAWCQFVGRRISVTFDLCLGDADVDIAGIHLKPF